MSGADAVTAAPAPMPSVRRKWRRSTCFAVFITIIPSSGSFALLRQTPLRRQGESLGFDVHEQPADGADRPVKAGGFRGFEIAEKAAEPGRQVFVEELTVRSGRR